MSSADAKRASPHVDEKSPASDSCITIQWLVDSGATSHMTPDKAVFASYTPTESLGNTIILENGGSLPVMGVGNVCFRTSEGVDLVLKDVRHAPGLANSILSVPALDEQGYNSSFVCGKYRLTRGSLAVVAEVEKVGRKYFVEGHVVSGEDPLSELWHKRLGHLDSHGVEKLFEKKLFPGLRNPTTDHCLCCSLAGLVTEKSDFSENSDFLKLVHVAFHGPFLKPSLSGATFFVTFVDDYSSKTWCYALKKRSQVVTAFEEFRSCAEGYTSKELKCVFHDQGKEYSSTLHKYCKRLNIQYICVPPGAPSVNNLAETISNNIKERISWILANAKLPWLYWELALSATVHVLNLCPAPSLNNDVPDRVWFGDDVLTYDHLRVFGCRALARVANDTTRECIFVGYVENGDGYKFYDPCKMEVFASRQAEFFEEQSILGTNKGKEEPQGAAATTDYNHNFLTSNPQHHKTERSWLFAILRHAWKHATNKQHTGWKP